MKNLKPLLTAGLALMLTAACGDDEPTGDPSDSESGDEGSDETDSPSEETDPDAGEGGDAGDGENVLDACSGFLTASWDRIRACESELAAILPANSLAASICGLYCEPGDEPVPAADFEACRAKAEALACEEIPSDVSAILSEIPEECAFMSDTLNCQFPEI